MESRICGAGTVEEEKGETSSRVVMEDEQAAAADTGANDDAVLFEDVVKLGR